MEQGDKIALRLTLLQMITKKEGEKEGGLSVLEIINLKGEKLKEYLKNNKINEEALIKFLKEEKWVKLNVKSVEKN